jgi:hypothetical protein
MTTLLKERKKIEKIKIRSKKYPELGLMLNVPMIEVINRINEIIDRLNKE